MSLRALAVALVVGLVAASCGGGSEVSTTAGDETATTSRDSASTTAAETSRLDEASSTTNTPTTTATTASPTTTTTEPFDSCSFVDEEVVAETFSRPVDRVESEATSCSYWFDDDQFFRLIVSVSANDDGATYEARRAKLTDPPSANIGDRSFWNLPPAPGTGMSMSAVSDGTSAVATVGGFYLDDAFADLPYAELQQIVSTALGIERPSTLGVTFDEYVVIWAETTEAQSDQTLRSMGEFVDLGSAVSTPNGRLKGIGEGLGFFMTFVADPGSGELTSIGVAALPSLEPDVTEDELITLWGAVAELVVATFEPDMTKQELTDFVFEVAGKAGEGVEMSGLTYETTLDGVIFEFSVRR